MEPKIADACTYYVKYKHISGLHDIIMLLNYHVCGSSKLIEIIMDSLGYR